MDWPPLHHSARASTLNPSAIRRDDVERPRNGLRKRKRPARGGIHREVLEFGELGGGCCSYQRCRNDAGSYPAGAATPPLLDAAHSFAALGGTTVTNTGTASVVGDLVVSPAGGALRSSFRACVRGKS